MRSVWRFSPGYAIQRRFGKESSVSIGAGLIARRFGGSSSALTFSPSFDLSNVVTVTQKDCKGFILGLTDEHFSVLHMFPEYEESAAHVNVGEFTHALSNLQRVEDIVNNIPETGNKNNMGTIKLFLELRTAFILRHKGNLQKAVVSLNRCIDSYKKLPPSMHSRRAIALCYQSLSLFEILDITGSAENALSSAQKAMEVCETPNYGESNIDEDIENAILSSSYSLMGLSHFLSGELDEAETFLQLSARWSLSPLQKLGSMTNLGSLCWSRSLQESSDEYGPLTRRLSLNTTMNDVKDENTNNLRMNDKNILDAIEYWEEALNSIAAPIKDIKPSPCGPIGDMPTLEVPGSASSAAARSVETKENTAQEGLLDTLLQNPHFATTYVHLLCNLAEAYAVIGEKEKSAEFVSSGIKVLNSFTASVDPSKAQHAAFVAPTLGRLLTQAAYAHMRAYEFVSAEGLFRSAIDKLSGPYAGQDRRYLFEKAYALEGYATLLSKWEKREGSAAAVHSEAAELVETVTASQNNVLSAIFQTT